MPSTVRFPQTWQILNRLPDSNLPEATVNSICAVLLNLCRLGSTAAISCRKEKKKELESDMRELKSHFQSRFTGLNGTFTHCLRAKILTHDLARFSFSELLWFSYHQPSYNTLFTVFHPSTILHTSVFSSSTILQTCIAPKTHSLACQQEIPLLGLAWREARVARGPISGIHPPYEELPMHIEICFLAASLLANPMPLRRHHRQKGCINCKRTKNWWSLLSPFLKLLSSNLTTLFNPQTPERNYCELKVWCWFSNCAIYFY